MTPSTRPPGPLRARHALRDPLWAFLALGAAAFGVDHALVRARPSAEAIAAPEGLEAALADDFRVRTGHAPDGAEAEALIAAWHRARALAAEARARGLDRDDPVIDRRLAQKLELALGAEAAVEAPDEAALARYRDAHAERLAVPERRTVEHVFFARATRGTSAERDASEALVALAAGHVDPRTLGDPFAAGRTLGPLDRGALGAALGASVADAAFAAAEGAWVGPVSGAYGAHLLRVGAIALGGLPSIDAMRDVLEAGVLEEAREAAVERAIEDVLARRPLVRAAETP